MSEMLNANRATEVNCHGVWAASTALFVVMLGFGIVVPLLPELTSGAAASGAVFSAVFVGYSAARLIAQVPGGVLVDRFGGRLILVVSLVAFAVSLAGFLIEGDLAYFTLVRVVEGAASGLTFPAVLAIAAARGPDIGMGRRIGTVVGIGSSGVLIGPVVGGALAPIDRDLPILVALGASVMAVVVVLASRGPWPKATPTRSVGQEVLHLLAQVRRRSLVGLLLPLAYNKLTFSGFQALLPLWGGQVLGLGIRGITGLFALTGILFAVCQPIAGALADRFEPRRLIAALILPLLVCLALLGTLTQPAAFACVYGGYVILTSSIFVATMRQVGRDSGEGPSGYGGAFGVASTATDLMTLVGPLVFLTLLDGDSDWLFPIVAAIGVPFCLGFLLFGRARD